MKTVFFVLFLFVSTGFFAQQESNTTCEHPLTCAVNGKYTLVFGKETKRQKPYLAIGPKNLPAHQIWLKLSAPQGGLLQLSLTLEKELKNGVQLFVFISDQSAICGSLNDPTFSPQLNRFIPANDSIQFECSVQKNQSAFLLLCSDFSETQLQLRSQFTADLREAQQEKVVDLRYSESIPTYTIVLRDQRTGFPVEGRITLQGSSDLTGVYRASTLKLNLKQAIKKGELKIDAEGYYSFDKKETRLPISSSNIDTFLLNPVMGGQLAALEQVYFAAGLPLILEESYPQLSRLRDFLLLNPSISIEIHGHVNEDNSNDARSERLSKKRANKVKEYLVKEGVDANRLFPVGYGNSKPIYKNPQTEEEKEANRRVEILIRPN
ncbi:MAG: hypothetical protein RLZZ301_176 [Bacteroidota bacterium]